MWKLEALVPRDFDDDDLDAILDGMDDVVGKDANDPFTHPTLPVVWYFDDEDRNDARIARGRLRMKFPGLDVKLYQASGGEGRVHGYSSGHREPDSWSAIEEDADQIAIGIERTVRDGSWASWQVRLLKLFRRGEITPKELVERFTAGLHRGRAARSKSVYSSGRRRVHGATLGASGRSSSGGGDADDIADVIQEDMRNGLWTKSERRLLKQYQAGVISAEEFVKRYRSLGRSLPLHAGRLRRSSRHSSRVSDRSSERSSRSSAEESRRHKTKGRRSEKTKKPRKKRKLTPAARKKMLANLAKGRKKRLANLKASKKSRKKR